MPATAHTFPGRYLPRLETVQILAADQKSRPLPHPVSMIRQAAISRAYISHTTTALRISQPGSMLHSSGCARS